MTGNSASSFFRPQFINDKRVQGLTARRKFKIGDHVALNGLWQTRLETLTQDNIVHVGWNGTVTGYSKDRYGLKVRLNNMGSVYVWHPRFFDKVEPEIEVDWDKVNVHPLDAQPAAEHNLTGPKSQSSLLSRVMHRFMLFLQRNPFV